MAHKSCGHFFISFQDGDNLFFKGPLEKSFDGTQKKEKKKKENRHISLKLLPLEDQAKIFGEETPSNIKALNDS